MAHSLCRAGFIEDAAFGLGYVGFDIQGQRMPLTGGFDVLVSRDFIGNPLDFGPWDVTLQGPLSLSVNYGGRAVREWEVGLNTASTENSANAPLNYVLNYDAGGQETQITGNLLIDSNVAINQFGFYEIELAYSSRQTVVRDGRFANDETDFDFDVGPIVVSGNIYADILAALTDPLFDAAGRQNPFESFSATSKINDAMQTAFADLEQLLAGTLDAGSAATLLAATTSRATGHVVPEPPILFLMAVAVPLLLGRRRHI